ncbi:fimbrin-like protein 2 [Dorcoceras hygrometricum]|uniref:Fimbrin-like protein 2 n=1 Tax=Dorcoceras hygrometricum TaxID=472368 RepID=A0A2Z7A0T2_9LAMI|nr:fimbrin-like protein 2 [Dorcoceras hygrometricum]
MDTQQPLVDTQQPFAQDFQTPPFSNIQSFTDLLNVNLHQHVSHERDRNIASPISFPSYSGDQHNVDESESSVSGEQNANAENVEMGRGRRRRRPTRCGTVHHLYY